MRRTLTTGLMACLALPAAAETPIAAMFPSTASCYLRQYSDSHLASHPDQLVSMIAIGPDPATHGADNALVLRLMVGFRGGPMALAYAYCGNDGGGIDCVMEGDAGGLAISPANGGGIRARVAPQGLWLETDGGSIMLQADSGDDRSFDLPPVPADACP